MSMMMLDFLKWPKYVPAVAEVRRKWIIKKRQRRPLRVRNTVTPPSGRAGPQPVPGRAVRLKPSFLPDSARPTTTSPTFLPSQMSKVFRLCGCLMFGKFSRWFYYRAWWLNLCGLVKVILRISVSREFLKHKMSYIKLSLHIRVFSVTKSHKYSKVLFHFINI